MKCLAFSCGVLFFAASSFAQSNGSAVLALELKRAVETPAVSGYEQQLAKAIRRDLVGYSPRTDNLGNVVITLGNRGVAGPHRLIVAPMDEPGYVVSQITDDGYLRLQRLPQGGPPPLFDQLYATQPVHIRMREGKLLDGIVAGISVHLQPGRLHPPDSNDLDEMFVDIGAGSAAEARKVGADLLAPVSIDHQLYQMGDLEMTAPAIGDRFGVAALLDLAQRLRSAKLNGMLTIAFVTQQWTGARGLQRLLEEVKADELLYVGRLMAGGPIAGTQGIRRAPRRDLGSGVLIGMPETGETLAGFPAEIKQLADANKIPAAVDYAAPLIPQSYLTPPALPGRWVHVGIATAWPSTPAEMIHYPDLEQLTDLLEAYCRGSIADEPRGTAGWLSAKTLPSGWTTAPPLTDILRELVETYGVSGHESFVRDDVKSMLPPWAKTETDPAGNLVLHLGNIPAESKLPRILVVAHMDEIGFEVHSISKEGRLEVEWRGRGELQFFAGHAALVHTDKGAAHPAVVELPNGWDQPGFQWPRGKETAIRVDVGARSPEEVEKLGIHTGDWVTIPKKYRKLAGMRANGRSFDDRVGCTALIAAVWALGGPLKNRDVTFLWSTGEEEGLVGAFAAAKRLAAEGSVPDYVFAVDTFVSSDSPLESKRFAYAELGKGFVVRAVDNSNIVPSDYVERVIKLARANQIPVQYGVTGGGNDGSAFLRFGSVDVALGWPLRYSHSPGEVVDTRDVDALARIVAAIARSW